MDEEIKTGAEPIKQEPVVKQEPVQLTAIEERASSQGWRPKDEWDGDPDEWVSAREFVRAGELFKKIDDQNRTIKDFKKTIDDLAKHQGKIAKVEYERAIKDLKAQKKEALETGDADAVIEVDDRIAEMREAQKEAPVRVQETPAVNPVFESWVSRNGWYNNQPAMKAYADRLGVELGGSMSPTDLLSHIEKEVKKEFAHKFTNPKRDDPSAVEGSTNKGGKGKNSYSLTDEERRVMQRFVKTVPGMTEEKYIADLRKIKGE